MPKLIGAREVVHQPVTFDFGRGRVWGGSPGMWASQGICSGVVAGGQAPEGGMVIGGMGTRPVRRLPRWKAPRRGLGQHAWDGHSDRRRYTHLGDITIANVAKTAGLYVALPATLGAGIAYLTDRSPAKGALVGALVGIGADIVVSTVAAVLIATAFARNIASAEI